MTSTPNTDGPATTGPNAEVRHLMTRSTARISPSAQLREVAEKLAAVEVGALVVGTIDDVSGIVSERDVTRALGLGEDPLAANADDIASTNLVWCDADTTVAEAARVMSERGVRHLLVGDGDLEGIVSARDLLTALAH